MLDFIDLPDYFDRNKFFNAFQTLETKALYAYFRCNNSTTFANLMRKYFPDRPLGMSTAEYVCDLLEDERNFNKELGIEPRVQQAEATPISKVTFGSTTVDEWDKPIPVVQPRVRTIDDIELSQIYWKQAGNSAQKAWLKKERPDPMKETVDAPYAEEDVFTRYS